MRTFIAIDLPASLKGKIISLQNELRPSIAGARWLNPRGIHFTLKFLGNTAENLIPSISAALEKICSAAEPFTIAIKGLGAFPTGKNPRVLWIGIRDNPQLPSLQGEIEEAISTLGFAPENRRFSPHITIARFKGHAYIPQEALSADREIGSFQAGEITFFQSILRPEGAEYLPLAVFRFSC